MARRKQSSTNLISRINLNPEISRGALTILLFIFAGLCLLSFFSKAGVVGEFLDALLAILFGQVRYVFPIAIAITALLVATHREQSRSAREVVGLILFFLSFNGLIHLSYTPEQMTSLGIGGGLIGVIFGWPLKMYVGYLGGSIILVGLLLIALIILFNITLSQIGLFITQILEHLNQLKQDFFKPTPPVLASAANIFSKPTKELPEDTEDEEEEEIIPPKPIFKRPIKPTTPEKPTENTSTINEDENQLPPASPFGIISPKVYKALPPTELLVASKSKPTSGDIKANAQIIAETFQNFGIEVEMGEIRVGPTVTQYSLKPAKGIKVARIMALSNDLALALAAHPIRIEAPIPGQSLIGIEVPNQRVAMVSLRELLESEEFKKREHNMFIALGKDVSGKVWLADLPKMPHLLIAGSTGSGKTVGINTIILSLLYENTPATLRLILVDPKRVELTLYNGIPHLLTPVITDSLKTVNALKWTIGEMERRFDMLSKVGSRDIISYNKQATEPLPYIVFVIDELADLMATSGQEVESGIIRIAQMARAVGIHLIVATQRPSVEVITGLMKANIPGRLAFSVASLTDSRTILDTPGAEKLLGRGDSLLLTADLSKPKRVQGAYVSEEEMKQVVDYLRGDEPPIYDDSIVSKQSNLGGSAATTFSGTGDQDSMFEEAKQLVIESGKASASLLQRRLKVGYARAARLLDELEEAGIVGGADGAKPREVFTEHLQSDEEIMPDEDATLDSGGTVFDAAPDQAQDDTKF